jgi:hypothetical protein
MNKELADLVSRRHRLRAAIEAQRMEVSEISQRWQKPLAVIDVGLSAVRLIRAVAGGTTVLMALRQRGFAGLALNGARLLFQYPSILSYGLKLLSKATRSPKEERNTGLER